MPHTLNPISNQISTSTHFGHSPNEPSGITFVPSLSYYLYINSNFWIVDSGANDHVCSSLHWFSSYYKIKPINVHLPNCSVVVTGYTGIITSSSYLYLSNALYTPEFSLNLLPVSKLCLTLNCTFQFFNDKCVLQF